MKLSLFFLALGGVSSVGASSSLRRRLACDLPEHACGADGGSLMCKNGFSFCGNPNDNADATCGCCAGSTHPLCPGARNDPVEDSLCEAVYACPSGFLMCQDGFSFCGNPAEHSDAQCGCCNSNHPLCKDLEVPGPRETFTDLDCSMPELQCPGGSLMCEGAMTFCGNPNAPEHSDATCGCCANSKHPLCPDAKDLLASLNQVEICSALQEEDSVDCLLADNSTGVAVCRGNTTTCVESAGPLLASDDCGCCAGDNSTMCMSNEEPEVLSACTEDMIAMYQCPLGEGKMGVYSCKMGFTSCVGTDTLVATDNCGCCPGVGHKLCQEAAAAGAAQEERPAVVTNRNGGPF